MIRKLLCVTTLSLLVTLSTSADHYDDFYVIPAAGHLPGAFGTFFQTDLYIQNFNETATLELEIVLLDSETGDLIALTESPLSIPPGGNERLIDLLDPAAGAEDRILGALLVGGNHPFAISSRTYNTGGSDGTFGQTIPGVRDFLENVAGMTPDMATAYLPGIVNNDDFRTNLGMVVGSNDTVDEDLEILVRLFDRNGTEYASTSYRFDPGELVQFQVPLSSIDPRRVSIAGASVAIVSGNGSVIPYVSVVDNRSGDANFILGNLPPSTPFAKTGFEESVFERAFRFFTGR